MGTSNKLTHGDTFILWRYLFFLKKSKEQYVKSDLIVVGALWIGMTIVFESFMNMHIRHLSLEQVLQTYYFWKGDTWLFVLLSLLISPLVADRMLTKNRKDRQ